MPRPRNAVILAAGMGTRLRPITENAPKCLTEVNGRPILFRQLDALQAAGVQKVTIVLGFCGEAVVDAVGTRVGSMEIDFRWNDIYADTNSMYSAWLARDILEQGCWLLEGDVVIGRHMLQQVLEAEAGAERTLWLAGRFGPESEGSMSVTDGEGRIREIRIVRNQLDSYPDNIWKSAGILAIQPAYGRAFSEWLTAEVNRRNTRVYYDLVLAERVEAQPIYIANIDAMPWMEVDNALDLRIAESKFRPRKHVIVVMDGAADYPIESLGGRTPLQAAKTPAIDRIAQRGRTGLISTMYPGVPVDSITGNMGILGFHPQRYYPSGRASFEALSQDIFLDEDDIAFRCNLISLKDVNGAPHIHDFTADNIPTEKTVRVINRLEFPGEDVELYSGQSYRNVLVLRDAGCMAADIEAAAPHRNMGKAIEGLMLRGSTDAARKVAERLNRLMLASIEQVRAINRDLKSSADMIWLWSPSSSPRMPSFEERFGLRGAIVAGLDFMRGIGEACGMHTKEIHGANGYLDTAYREKLKFAKNFLLHNDLVFVHVNAPDEEGHAGRVQGKVQAIENIDREIVGPLVEYLEKRYPDNYRIAVMPDHYTCLKDAQHLDLPVPYCLAGAGIDADDVERYDEPSVGARYSDSMMSIDFMRRFVADGAF